MRKKFVFCKYLLNLQVFIIHSIFCNKKNDNICLLLSKTIFAIETDILEVHKNFQ